MDGRNNCWARAFAHGRARDHKILWHESADFILGEIENTSPVRGALCAGCPLRYAWTNSKFGALFIFYHKYHVGSGYDYSSFRV